MDVPTLNKLIELKTDKATADICNPTEMQSRDRLIAKDKQSTKESQ